MGGLAFKDKTRRIAKAEIGPTLKWLGKKTGLVGLCSVWNLLGSALRSSSAGDLDLNVCRTRYDINEFLKLIEMALPPEDIKDRRATGQIFTCVPIEGKPENGYVQVDFMFGDRDWQEFSYYSAGDQMSRYKGLFRTELIKAAVAFHSDWTLMEDGELVARVGPTFFHDRGLVWRYRHRPMRKDGKGRVQAFEVVDSYEEFLKLYPTATKASRVNPILDEDEVAFLLFGTRAEQVVSAMHRYEDLQPLFRDTYDTTSYAQVMDLFLKRLNSLKVDIPEDILDEISTAISAAHATI